jgi:hypothetical protein
MGAEGGSSRFPRMFLAKLLPHLFRDRLCRSCAEDYTATDRSHLVGIRLVGTGYSNLMIGEFVVGVSKIDPRHMAAHAILPRFGANLYLGAAIRDCMARYALGVVECSLPNDIIVRIMTGGAAQAPVLRIRFKTLATRQTVGLKPNIIYVAGTIRGDFFPGPVAFAAKSGHLLGI